MPELTSYGPLLILVALLLFASYAWGFDDGHADGVRTATFSELDERE